MRLFILLGAALMLPLASRAQAPGAAGSLEGAAPLTLKECLGLGLENNYDLRIARGRQEIAGNNATLGNAGYLPSADLSAGYSGSLNDMRQEQRTGGVVTKTNGANNNTLNAGVNLNWTLFNGFSVRTTYKRLQELESVGELNTRMAVENYIAGLSTVYYDYIRQLIRLKNMKRTIDLSQERVRIAELSYSLGVFSRQEYQQAKLDLNADESSLIKQYESLHALHTHLNELTGAQEVERAVIPADSMISYAESLERAAIEESMLAQNVYLLAAEKQRDISGLDVKLARSRSYPYLRASGGYGYTQNWYGSGANREQRTMGLNYGLTLGITLFDGMNQRREVRNAAIESRISELSLEQTEQGLRKDLSDAWMAYANNMSLVGLESRNVELAQDNYRITLANYKEGQLSGYELRAAQVTLLNAEERLVTAEYDTKLCEITLFQIAGQILSYLQ